MKKDIIITASAIVLVAAVTFGLQAVRRDLPLTPSSPFHPAVEKGTSAAPAEVAKEGTVIMRVNGEPITDREFAAFLESIPAQSRVLYSSTEGQRALADELVKLKTLEQEGRRLGVQNDPKVQSQIEIARAQITAQRALEKLVEQGSEKKMQELYEKEKNNAVSLRHIAIAYAGGSLPARDQKPAPPVNVAMAKAAAVAKRLRAGADFAKVAAEESDDLQTANNGGMLGPAKPSAMPKEIASVVGKLKPGQLSDPVKTQYAVHLFKVETPSFEELQPMLSQEVRQQTMVEEIERLQKAAKVDLDPKFFPAEAKAPPMNPAPPAPKEKG